MKDLHDEIMNLSCEPDTAVRPERLAFKRGHKQARHAAAELAAGAQDQDPAGAAIAYALDFRTECPMEFLRCWNGGDFEAIRAEWPDAPEEVFIGADTLHKSKQDSA